MSQPDENKINIKAVVDRLIGDVEAWGESHHDKESNENLGVLGDLYWHIQSTLCRCARLTSRYEGSMNACGKIAIDYLKMDLEYVRETIEECEKQDAYKRG